MWVVKTSDERIKMLFGLCTLASKRNWVRDRYLPVGQFWGFILMCVCVCVCVFVRSFVRSRLILMLHVSVCLSVTQSAWGNATCVCLSVCLSHSRREAMLHVCVCVCLSVCLSQSRRLAILSGIESSSVHRRYWRAIIVAHVCLSVCHRVVVRQCYLTQKPTVSIVATGERSWRTTRNSTTPLGRRSSWRGLSSPDTSRNTCMCWTPSPRKVLLCFALGSANLLFCRRIVKLLCFLPTRHYASVSCCLVSVCNNNNNNNKCICIRS